MSSKVPNYVSSGLLATLVPFFRKVFHPTRNWRDPLRHVTTSQSTIPRGEDLLSPHTQDNWDSVVMATLDPGQGAVTFRRATTIIISGHYSSAIITSNIRRCSHGWVLFTRGNYCLCHIYYSIICDFPPLCLGYSRGYVNLMIMIQWFRVVERCS